MLVTYLLQFMFAVIGVQLFKVIIAARIASKINLEKTSKRCQKECKRKSNVRCISACLLALIIRIDISLFCTQSRYKYIFCILCLWGCAFVTVSFLPPVFSSSAFSLLLKPLLLYDLSIYLYIYILVLVSVAGMVYSCCLLLDVFFLFDLFRLHRDCVTRSSTWAPNTL